MTFCNQGIYLSRSITNVLCVLQVREVSGITIFRSSATMYFANAELYLEALKKKVNIFNLNLVTIKYIFSVYAGMSYNSGFQSGAGAHKGAFHPKGDLKLFIIRQNKH